MNFGTGQLKNALASFSFKVFSFLPITGILLAQKAFALDSNLEAIRTEWFAIYGDIFQKFAFTAVSAYLLTQNRHVRSFFEKPATQQKITSQKLIIISILIGLGIAGIAIGYFRDGESDWSFLDLGLVFTVITGLLMGIRVGLGAGLISALARLLFGVMRSRYFFILIGAGMVAGFFAARSQQKLPSRKNAVFAGVLASFFQGLLIHGPLWRSNGVGVTFEIIFALAVIESLCVYIFIAIVFGVMERERRKKLEKLLPEMKLKFLQAQINPHFLFNTLNTIAAICSREKAEQARDLVVKLSNYFRRIVKREDEWVTLEEELEHVKSYLDIEKARYQQALQVKNDIQLGKRGLRTYIPILIIQPLVENAIRHGIVTKPGGGRLEICARENEKTVEVIIRDNGAGIPPAVLKKIESENGLLLNTDENREGSGVGLRNINQRLQYQFGPEYRLEIHSEVGVGTTVKFKLPIEHQKGD